MLMNLTSSILILLTLTTFVSGIADKLSVKDIKQLQNALHEASEYMSREVKEEDAVICIGATRSGKSTLVNYLIGNDLVAEKISRSSPVSIRKTDPQSKGPKIGGGSTSETIIPTRWTSSNLPSLVIWDSPGFDDNRGPIQDITNAFYLHQLLDKLKTLRIVLTIDINDIVNDNIKPFVSVLNAVETLIGAKNRTHSSILSVIFTKVPDTINDNPVDAELISEILDEKFLKSRMSLSATSRDIVEFLVNNNNHIAFFKRAKPGKVTSALDENIFPAIINSAQLDKDTLKGLHPSISENSKIYLYQSRNMIMPKEEFYDFENVVRYVLDQKVHNVVNTSDTEEAENKTRNHLTQLDVLDKQLYDALTLESDFYKKMEIIQIIDAEIKKQVEEHNLLEKIKLMEFVDKLIDMEEGNQLSLSLQGVILSAHSRVREAITSAQLSLGEITEQKHNELLEEERRKHQEEMDDLKKKMDEVAYRNQQTSSIFDSLLNVVVDAVGTLTVSVLQKYKAPISSALERLQKRE